MHLEGRGRRRKTRKRRRRGGGGEVRGWKEKRWRGVEGEEQQEEKERKGAITRWHTYIRELKEI